MTSTRRFRFQRVGLPPPAKIPNVSPFSLKSLKLTTYADSGFEQGMSATGFLVELNQSRDIVLVTNYHVVTWRALDGSFVEGFEQRVPTILRIELPSASDALAPSHPDTKHWEIPLMKGPEATRKPVWFQDGDWWLKTNGRECTTDVVVFPIPRSRKDELSPYTYQWHQTQAEPLIITDNVFVVGYPQSVGKYVSSTPIWTRGSVASEPEVGPADRFFIDSRTRSDQSGSPVIAHQYPFTSASELVAKEAVDEVGEVAFLQGVYSGRTDKDSDIGSVWTMEVVERIAYQIPVQMYTRNKNPFEPTLPNEL